MLPTFFPLAIPTVATVRLFADVSGPSVLDPSAVNCEAMLAERRETFADQPAHGVLDVGVFFERLVTCAERIEIEGNETRAIADPRIEGNASLVVDFRRSSIRTR